MGFFKKMISGAAALLLSLLLCACTIPVPGFADYDVSGYIQALLDSSYHNANDELMAVTKITEDKARENNVTTVENAAATFCNTYGLSPSDEQLEELEQIMKRAFELTKYTVKDERKVEDGYYLEVDVSSIVNFAQREEDIEELRTQAQQEATGAKTNANTLFVDKVLEFCLREVANISYDQETRTVPLDIRQTAEGELQLDLNQIARIDQTVVRFTK